MFLMELHHSLKQYESIMKVTSFNDLKNSAKGYKRNLIYTGDQLQLNKCSDYQYCQFQESVVLDFPQIPIEFTECVFLNGINLSNYNSSIVFKNCYFVKDNLISNKQNNDKTCTIDECIFEENRNIEFGLGNLEIINSRIDKLTFLQTIGYINLSGKDGFIDELEINKSCERIEKIKIEDEFEISRLLYNPSRRGIEFTVYGNVFIKQLTFRKAPNNILLKALSFDTLEVQDNQASFKFESDLLSGDNLKIVSNDNVTVAIYHSDVRTISLSDFSVNSKLRLKTIRKLNKLSILRVRAIDVKISELELGSLGLADSDFDKWNIGYIDWGRNFKLFQNNDLIKGTDSYLSLIETNRKLKKYFRDRHSFIDAEIFQVNELSSYLSYLLLKLRKVQITKSGIKIPVSINQIIDLILLGSNKIFSGFGRSLINPILFGALIHYFFFSFIIKHEQIGIDLCFGISESCKFSWDLLALYFSFFNPIHKLTDVNGEVIISTADFFMRVSSGYFIYYIIKATRKFGRT